MFALPHPHHKKATIMKSPATIRPPAKRRRAFSLVEVLAAITIIGIIIFLAVPNIVRVKQDSEDNLARARAETLNMAMAAYVQAVGTNTAQSLWASADNNARYGLIRQYIAFSEANITNFNPSGYSLTLPTNISPLTTKTTVTDPRGSNVFY
jgi:prepilin-type N-terminal cleavage/methylation domain-containing protein